MGARPFFRDLRMGLQVQGEGSIIINSHLGGDQIRTSEVNKKASVRETRLSIGQDGKAGATIEVYLAVTHLPTRLENDDNVDSHILEVIATPVRLSTA